MDALDPDFGAPGQAVRRALSKELRTISGEPVVDVSLVGYEGMEELVGWDARVLVAEVGDDPFEEMTDDDLLNANPGILAAMAAAQANQMRILDSAIIPDGHLVERAPAGGERFNEFRVSTPAGLGEKFVAWTEAGEPEVVEPSAPFYPGLAERADSGKSPLVLGLDDDVADPFAMSMAYACVLLQIGVEAGLPVSAFAEVVSAAWGSEHLFHTGTLAGVAGVQDHSEIFGMDRSANPRRLCSWQTASAVRSGQLAMTRADWGDYLHCDFRRVRVAAESLFAASVVMDEFRAPVSGTLTYFVPPTCMLSADPQYLFFRDVDPRGVAVQEVSPAAKKLVQAAEKVGVIRALWPNTDPVVTETWLATRNTTPSIASIPWKFEGPSDSGARLRAAATARIPGLMSSPVGATGRTLARKASARLATLTTTYMDYRSVEWTSRFLSSAEVLQCSPDKKTRNSMILTLSGVLSGEVARALERAFSDKEMEGLFATLPETLRGATKVRSSKTVIFSLLHTVGNADPSHTVLRAARRTLSRGKAIAATASVGGKMFDPVKAKFPWLDARLHRLRQFWASIYMGLPGTRHAWVHLPSDVRWWIDVASTVNSFRASVMRSITMNRDDRVRAKEMDIHGCGIYMAPYPAAAAFRREMSASLACEIPEFKRGEVISDWLAAVETRIIPALADAPKPKVISASLEDATVFRRAISLVDGTGPLSLSAWVERTFQEVGSDLRKMRTDVLRARAAAKSVNTVKAPPNAAAVSASTAVLSLPTVLELAGRVSDCYEAASDRVDEDTWDEFCLAVADTGHPLHAEAKEIDHALKKGVSEERVDGFVTWILDQFFEEEPEEDTGATLI